MAILILSIRVDFFSLSLLNHRAATCISYFNSNLYDLLSLIASLPVSLYTRFHKNRAQLEFDVNVSIYEMDK